MTADWLGPRTFPNLWMKACKLWVIVALGALIMPLIVWIMIFIENTKTFSDTMNHYLGNDQSVYDRMDGDPNAGYVGNTNIPKHLGGVVFAAAFDISMWVIIVIAACADLFWRFPICKQLIDAFYAQGLHDTRGLVDIEFYFLVVCPLFFSPSVNSNTFITLPIFFYLHFNFIFNFNPSLPFHVHWAIPLQANAFLKLFIVAATGSQTYTGLYPDNKQVDTPLFSLYATMILLCSIPLTLIALFFILHAMKREEYAAAQKVTAA
ncbi:hypothetical protein J007_02007 [Cryptococcus neoformans]|nr:hypothetical protein J007_02007 [Cryptococcus neoformans var. grubii]OXC62533.1 hypothetical protein C358_02075 [Cryptococcus neoformans var. grubii MW-RSA852]